MRKILLLLHLRQLKPIQCYTNIFYLTIEKPIKLVKNNIRMIISIQYMKSNRVFYLPKRFRSLTVLILILGFGLWNYPFITGSTFSINSQNSLFQPYDQLRVFAQNAESPDKNRTELVYHLSSDEPWRATIALLDSQTMLKMGYNVTLMLSIEGVQLGVKNPHQYLGLNPLIQNVSNFMNKGGTVIICEVCIKIAGYNNSDIIDGSIIGSPTIMANLLNKTTVVDY